MTDTLTVENETRHGELDQEAGIALDALVAMAFDMGVTIDAGELMSRSVRLYYLVVTGEMVVTPSTEMDALAEGGPADVSQIH